MRQLRDTITVNGCRDTIAEAWTKEKFHKNMDDDVHTTYFYQFGDRTCTFECEKGSLNAYALHKHIQKDVCEDGETLFEDIKKCKQCNHSSGRNPDILTWVYRAPRIV
jgi:hypothetical protein